MASPHDPGGRKYPVLDVHGSAVYTQDGLYRYVLTREWNPSPQGRLIAFIGLNPAAAESRFDDETVRTCWQWARDHGYSSFAMLNVYAYRATNPKCIDELRRRKADELAPVGPLNDQFLAAYTQAAARVVAAWGRRDSRADKERLKRVRQLLGSTPLYTFGASTDPYPRHPNNRRAKPTKLTRWRWP
jgi:hypothetical protein